MKKPFRLKFPTVKYAVLTATFTAVLMSGLIFCPYSEAKKVKVSGVGTYNGKVDDCGLFSGKGKMKYLNGDLYEGHWQNGLRHGQGKLTTASGMVYEGDWVNDDLRYGKLKYKTMGEYEGYFKDLKLHGYGIRRYPDKTVEGRWNNDKRDGVVKETDKKGKVTTAFYKDGVKTALTVRTDLDRMGIDISRYQANVLWPLLYFYMDGQEPDYRLNGATKGNVSPVEFVIIKATEGGDHKDPMMLVHADNAERFGYPRGFYHFYNKTSSPEANAANYIANVHLDKEDIAPILDIEVEGVKVDDLVKWLKIIEKHYGRKPLIYTNERFYKMYVEGTPLAKYPLWYARYGRKDIDRGAKILQFTEKGQLDGVSGHTVDINILRRGSLDDLVKGR